jgi:cobalt/nickel transport protein
MKTTLRMRVIDHSCAVLGALAAVLPAVASAHFQMLYVPESALDRGAAMTMAIVFTHPFSGGPTMDMGTPRRFVVLAQKGEDAKPATVDLARYLQPVEWQGVDNKARAFAASLPREIVRSLGDYVFLLEPEPYHEEEEDKYIQQFTKLVMNVGGVPGNWAESQGLPAEIQPLDKPYANWVGGVFRGVVLGEGKPVPFAEIEVEYVNHEVDLAGKRFATAGAVVAPRAVYKNLSIRADANGVFTIGLPRAGWWGVCALGVGPTKIHLGKPLSQDAVLWIHAKDMR